MYSAGWVICYTPFLIMLNDWFSARRSLAYGILFGASGVSGLIIPFLLETLLIQRVVDENYCANERARGGRGGCDYDAVCSV